MINCEQKVNALGSNLARMNGEEIRCACVGRCNKRRSKGKAMEMRRLIAVYFMSLFLQFGGRRNSRRLVLSKLEREGCSCERDSRC